MPIVAQYKDIFVTLLIAFVTTAAVSNILKDFRFHCSKTMHFI